MSRNDEFEYWDQKNRVGLVEPCWELLWLKDSETLGVSLGHRRLSGEASTRAGRESLATAATLTLENTQQLVEVNHLKGRGRER